MELTLRNDDIASIFDKGLQAHNAGDLSTAEQLYQETLSIQPNHCEANHNIGVVLAARNELDKALKFFKYALDSSPNVSLFWASYIDALIKLDRIAESKTLVKAVKQAGISCEKLDAISHRLEIEHQEPGPEASQELDELIELQRFDDAIQACLSLMDTYPRSAVLNINLGKCYFEQGQIEQAISSYEKGTECQPTWAVGFTMLGQLYSSQEDTNQAIASLKKALDLGSESHELYATLGLELLHKGKHGDAIEYLKEALRLKPNSTSTLSMLGDAYNGSDQHELAIGYYKKALTLDPNDENLHFNIGNAYGDAGNLEAAVESYKEAIKIKPDFAEAFCNLGKSQKDRGELVLAIESFKQAVDFKPNFPEALFSIGLILKNRTFSKKLAFLPEAITTLLDQKTYVRPSDIALAATSLIVADPIFQNALKQCSLSQPEQIILKISNLPLLLKIMELCPIPNLQIESFLTYLRSEILYKISKSPVSKIILDFQSRLALQCYTNEYVYAQSDRETAALEKLENSVETTLISGQQPELSALMCLASYKALHDYKWCSLVFLPDSLAEFKKRQVLDFQTETDLKEKISLLENIKDNVSSLVKKQYEEHPYPRWVNLQLSLAPKSIIDTVTEIGLKIVDKSIYDCEAPQILIAGCGTGQHSIGTAARFKNCKVFAIDLSLSSLAYAKRKTQELKVKNIEYMQGDILSLGKLDKQFDIVESSGVLHHMDNPVAGWKILSDVLKPGGLMKIGLYSELSRQDIVRLRSELGQGNSNFDRFKIRDLRRILIKSNREHHKKIFQSPDFYSMSSIKDLLFHVKEHRFTLTQISDCLAKLNLKFCGFEADHILESFKQQSVDPNDLYELKSWSTFEEQNPNAFSGMYQFWCQKLN